MNKCKILAEACCNHGGSMETAEKMIKVAANYCEVDVVKFQKRCVVGMSYESFHRPYDNPHSFGKTYGQHRDALEFNIDQHAHLKEVCEDNGVEYSCSVWDMKSAEDIVGLKPKLIKVPSAKNCDFEIIGYLAEEYKGEIHISLGMTTVAEKKEIYKFIEKSFRADDFVLYHCTSGYPVQFEDVFLGDIEKVKHHKVGYSGHHLGIAVDVAAYELGCQWIERHFTLDRTSKGTDHAASLEPEGMRKLVRDLRHVWKANAISDGGLKDVEKPNREKLR